MKSIYLTICLQKKRKNEKYKNMVKYYFLSFLPLFIIKIKYLKKLQNFIKKDLVIFLELDIFVFLKMSIFEIDEPI